MCLHMLVFVFRNYVPVQIRILDTVMHVDVDVWLMRAIGLCNCPVVRNETEGDSIHPNYAVYVHTHVHDAVTQC